MYFKIQNTPTLNGWFDGFCPSKGIAENLNKKAAGVRAQTASYEKTLESVKNGKQAAQWEALKNQMRILDKEIKKLRQDLENEKTIAAGIGLDISTLGAWCNGAVSARKKAEESLQAAEKELGKIKGIITTIQNQQRYGIVEAFKTIKENKKNISELKSKIENVKTKITEFKAARDNERKENAKNEVDKKTATKSDILGKLKENALPIAGGLAVVTAGFLYMRNKKKKRKKKTTKKVEA